jgi:hypothetical protein
MNAPGEFAGPIVCADKVPTPRTEISSIVQRIFIHTEYVFTKAASINPLLSLPKTMPADTVLDGF